MKSAIGLEEFRQIFRDNRTHIAVAKIERLSMVEDRSMLKAMVSIFPEQREVIARMSWEMVGNGSGIIAFPQVGDLVLVAFADGDDDTAFIIRRLTSKEDKIPVNAVDGHVVIKSNPEKKVWISTDDQTLISKGDTFPTENLVLGQQLKTLLVDILTKLNDLSTKVAQHTHAGNLGYPTSPPNQSAQFVNLATGFDNLKASPVQSEDILSSFAFTMRG